MFRSMLRMALLVVTLTFPGHVRAEDFDESLIRQPEILIEKIQTEQGRLRHIRVVATLSDEVQQAESGQWLAISPMVELTAWHDGTPDGPARIEVRREICEWNEPAVNAKLGISSYVLTYDGVQGKQIFLVSGSDRDFGPIAYATVYSERPMLISRLGYLPSGYGAPFSNALVIDYEEKRSLSAILRHRLDASLEHPSEIMFSVSADKLNERNVLHIEVRTTRHVDEDWWLDPARGYSLLRRCLAPGKQKRWVADYQVAELMEAAGV